jgi:hypothetical protein
MERSLLTVAQNAVFNRLYTKFEHVAIATRAQQGACPSQPRSTVDARRLQTHTILNVE